MDSILGTIKKMLGIPEEYNIYDTDLIININENLNVLYQIGLGEKPFAIRGSSETWTDLLGDSLNLETVKSYIYLRVKQIFDPPSSSAMNEAMNNRIKELESRISFQVDSVK